MEKDWRQVSPIQTLGCLVKVIEALKKVEEGQNLPPDDVDNLRRIAKTMLSMLKSDTESSPDHESTIISVSFSKGTMTVEQQKCIELQRAAYLNLVGGIRLDRDVRNNLESSYYASRAFTFCFSLTLKEAASNFASQQSCNRAIELLVRRSQG
jgi:hypothetical protein